MDAQFDSESYWNKSASKAFSFDDDDDDDELGYKTGFQKTTPDDNLLADDISEASFDNTQSVVNLTLSSVISEADLELILNEQPLQSRVLPKAITVDEEIKLLRRKIQYMVDVPPPKVTSSIILSGQNCSLEVYKSLNDKEELLDEVINNGDGNGVIGVLLFLHRTLNKKQFYQILRQRPQACDHYINYLVQTKNREAIEILSMLGRHQESALLQFTAALRGSSDIRMTKQRIKQFLDSYTDTGMFPIFSQIFANSLNLIQIIENSKNVLGDTITAESSAVEVLYASCAKHRWINSSTTNEWNPFKIAAIFQISPVQFEWTALNERAKTQSYADLEGVFEKSSWTSLTKQKQFSISFSLETAIQRLADLNAPQPVLHSFLTKVSSPSEKLAISKRVKCPKAIIDALATLKDLPGLETYKDTLSEGSEEKFYCENTLKNMARKWSTDGLKIIR